MITMGEKRKENMPCSVRQTTSLDESCRKHGNSKPITWLVDAMNSKSKDLIFDDRPVIPGITIKAARLDALIHLLVNSFMPVGGLEMGNDNFPRIVFLMHQWFIKSDELAEELVELFWHCDKLFTCHSRCRHSFKQVAECQVYRFRARICHTFRFWHCDKLFTCHSRCRHSLKQVAECQVYRFRARICHTFRYWVLTFPIHFDLNPTLTSKIYDFQIQLRNREYHGLAEFVDLSKLPSYDWTRNISVRHPPAKHTRKVSLVFDHLEAGELAEHITYLEHKVMRRITFIDFKNYAEKGTLQDNPKLERSIALFNGLSQWIQCMVLTRSLPQQRADVIVKFVSVAKKLLQLKNFNSLMAVVGGLSHSALARLSHTMAFVPTEAQKSLADLTELLSSTSNFSNYRKSLAESTGFRIPILGVHMKDLISLEVALPDTLDKDPEFINFRKIAQLSLIFQELWELQNSIPSLSVNLDLVNTLRLSLDTAYTEDELYELSLTLEPRNPTSPQLSPTKPTVFAEWATGSCNPPEPEVLEKHINAMVEAVFKNYDTDKDGYISHEEFEAIASNFPFIDAFCILDVDQDGMISKTEMKRYFLQANCRTLRTSFQHDFHETTYFRPTFCARCAGLLWGLIKQGYKCRDCGINAHKHCKELIVLECRRNNMLSPRSNSFAGTDASTIKSRFQRHWRKHSKISQSEGDGSINPRMSTESCHCDNGFITVETPTDELRQSINSVKAASFDVKDLDVLIKDSISVSISRDLPAAESHCRCQQDVYLSKSSIENVYSQSSLISHPNS